MEFLFPKNIINCIKKKGSFKLDTSVKINELSVENGHAIKITADTPNNSIATFIREKVV